MISLRFLSFLIVFISVVAPNGMKDLIVLAQSNSEPTSPDTGTPQGQQGVGGTRPETSCPDANGKNLMAIVQGRGQDLTRSESPFIWLYIPYSATDISYLEFSLHDRQLTQTFYRTEIAVPDSPGLIKIPIAYALVPQETYRWYFKLYCQPHQPGGNTKYYYLQNWIQYQPNASPETAWYDRITEVGDQYFAHPENPQWQTQWQALLTTLALPDWIAQEPLAHSSLVQEK